MREILFRGKRLDNGEWVEGFYVHIPCGRFDADEHLIQTIKDNGKIGMLMSVDPSTVGQYTGLADKNGARIYEGDIVAFRTRTSFFKPCYVRWYEENVRFVVTMPDGVRSYPMDKSWDYEVIGNIHDNPELLEGEE